MIFKKKIRNCQIILPTLYNGSKKPKEPRNGDIWQNEHTNEINVFVGNKWFKVLNDEETGYTEQEKIEMKEKEQIKNKKIEKVKNTLKEFRELLYELGDD